MSTKKTTKKTRRDEPDGSRELSIEETEGPTYEELRDRLAVLGKAITQQTQVLELLLAATARQLQIAEAEHRFGFSDRPAFIARDRHGLYSRVEAALTDETVRRTLTPTNNNDRADNECSSNQGASGDELHDPARTD